MFMATFWLIFISTTDALALCGITISKETAATLLSDMTSIAVDHEKTGPKEKAKKNKKQNTSSDSSPEGFPRGKKENWSGSLDVLNVVVKRESEIVSKEEVTNALSRCSSEASLNNIKHRGSISSFLPSHLRPPLIVTGLSGLIDNDSRPPSGSATDTSEDQWWA